MTCAACRPSPKLAVQTGAALFLYVQGFQIQAVSSPLGGSIELGVLALPVTVLWLVGMSNAFNLIDGLDGLAAGLALVSTLGLLAAAVLNDRWETVAIAAALAGALLGFLPYNFIPARVFLGDCGSLTVGFTLAAIAMQSSIKTSAAIAVAVPLLALALPILDVGLAVMRRFVRRRPVFGADHNHIHHRLIGLGLTPRRAVVTLYGVATLFTALALAAAVGPKQVGWAAVLIVLLLIVLGVRALGYWEVTEFQRSFVTRLAAGVRPAGDAALRGLEEDLAGTRTLGRGVAPAVRDRVDARVQELHVVPQAKGVECVPGAACVCAAVRTWGAAAHERKRRSGRSSRRSTASSWPRSWRAAPWTASTSSRAGSWQPLRGCSASASRRPKLCARAR